MSVNNKNSVIRCTGTEITKCRNKSKKETSVEVAFANAEKSGWTKEKVTDKFTRYYCPKCTHALTKLETIKKAS